MSKGTKLARVLYHTDHVSVVGGMLEKDFNLVTNQKIQAHLQDDGSIVFSMAVGFSNDELKFRPVRVFSNSVSVVLWDESKDVPKVVRPKPVSTREKMDTTPKDIFGNAKPPRAAPPAKKKTSKKKASKKSS